MRRGAAVRLLAGLTAAGALAACSDDRGVLDPAGPGARRTANLWWYLFAVSAAVVVLVVVLVLAVARRRHRGADNPEVDHDAPSGMRWVLAGGVLLPAVILPLTFGLTLWTMVADAGDDGELTVEVTGRQWFWDVRYEGTDAVTANEIHIPVGVPVRFELVSDDVAHSFWVPRLSGKIDLIPGTTNELVLQADHAGTYEGRCAEFCGLQHATMRFLVVAEPRDEFDRWLADQRADAPVPSDAAAQDGFEVFQSSCSYCHTVRGTGITGDIGPDLTHVASRAELGAGAVPNTPGHLAGWIMDSQGVKPGNRMPPMDLTGEDLQELLAYVETLR